VCESEVLLPAEAARRLDVPARVIVKAMYDRTILHVRLEDGTSASPPTALDTSEPRRAERRLCRRLGSFSAPLVDQQSDDDRRHAEASGDNG
jgi:hypothetical protein